MKNADKLALAAVILLIVSRVAPMTTNICLASWGPSSFVGDISWLHRASAVGMLPVMLLINIAIGIWLFREAKREAYTPWVWLLFGFVFQLTAVAVFYLIRIHSMLKNERNGTSEPNIGQVSSEGPPSDEPTM